MKLKNHVYVELVLFIFLYYLIGLEKTIIVISFHFIPSIDYLMKRINFYEKLHRQLFHNIFIIIITGTVLFLITKDPKLCILSISNFVLHIIMDLGGKGVAIFFPLSRFRLKVFR